MDFNIYQKIIAISLIVLFNSSSLYAQGLTSTSTNGSFTLINKDEKAPFGGVLLDPLAIAIILTEKEQSDTKNKLYLNYSLEKQKNEFDLKLKNIQLNLDYQIKTDLELIKSKDEELAKVRDIALNNGSNQLLILGGGVLGGIVLTILVLWVSNKVQN